MKKLTIILSMAFAIFTISCGDKATDPIVTPPETSFTFTPIAGDIPLGVNADVISTVDKTGHNITLTGVTINDTVEAISTAIDPAAMGLMGEFNYLTMNEVTKLVEFLEKVVTVKIADGTGDILLIMLKDELSASSAAKVEITVRSQDGIVSSIPITLTLTGGA